MVAINNNIANRTISITYRCRLGFYIFSAGHKRFDKNKKIMI